MLPEIKEVRPQSLTFPTAWQTVIFRNFSYVRTERIAAILGCSCEVVEKEAQRLGLSPENDEKIRRFERQGYITVIRNNWYLLPYRQLLMLLGMSEGELDLILEKEDFLGIKLGNFKPSCEEVLYSPLSDEDIRKTEKIAQTVREYSNDGGALPFSFFENSAEDSSQTSFTKGSTRIVHPYLAPCNDVFLKDSEDYLPDALLERYKKIGINGIWLHGVLSELSEYPFLPEYSKRYEERRKNLGVLIERCARYGVKVYLYFNEPRSLPHGVSEEHEALIGDPVRRTLCLENKATEDYLYGAVRSLCESANGLGGIFTITMSENPTHCNYSRRTRCPVCQNIPPEVSASKVNNIINRAIRDSGCGAELIANLWGWSPFLGWSEEQTFRGIELLDKDISVLCVSEYDLEIEKGGTKSRVIDYSISNPGPSEISRNMLKKAAECGHKVYAKIQASNSWESSSVPYIPVFDLVHEHLQNLADIGVSDYFLTWTLGGYPSPSLEIASKFNKDFSLDVWYSEKFGENAEAMHRAILTLCDAFREFPFSISVLYNSPKNLGPANLWDTQPEEKKSTMVCYSFDDVESWAAPYTPQVYVSQLKKLIDGWEKGLSTLESICCSPLEKEIERYARVALIHFRSDLLQTEFALCKREGDRDGMRICAEKEMSDAKELLALVREDARIGFEASNHYFYTERNLVEKIVRMRSFAEMLGK